MERIALAREHRVAEWLRDAYMELIQKTPLDFEELLVRPAEPYSDPLDRKWEAEAKKWEAISRDWETLARISRLQTKVATSAAGSLGYYDCDECCMTYTKGRLCKCRILAMVDKAFRGELESLRENPVHVEHPLPRKLPISYLCPLKTILFIANSTDSTALPKRKRRKFGA
jgi:hypothetical protein